MGCFDWAEVCELVWTFFLNKLNNVFQNNTFGLYRDDGLAIIRVGTSLTWPKAVFSKTLI